MGYKRFALSLLLLGQTVSAQAHSHAAAAPTQKALQQIREVRRAAASWAHPDSARASGFESVLGWIPTMGTHWVHGGRMLVGANPKLGQPSQLMFSPVGGKQTLVGAAFAYFAAKGDSTRPAFIDGNPPWHDHPDLAPPGTNLVMLHVWFVASPDGPFAGHNPFLPYFALGLTPPDTSRMRDAVVSLRVRKAALALSELVDTAGLFPVIAARPAVKPVLESHRKEIRAIVAQLEPARKEKDQRRWDELIGQLAAHWDAMSKAYLKSAVNPTANARIVTFINNMLGAGADPHH